MCDICFFTCNYFENVLENECMFGDGIRKVRSNVVKLYVFWLDDWFFKIKFGI